MEIERKFAIKYLPENLEAYPKKEIEQGYLCTKPVVRIRKSNDDYILTYKSKGNKKKEEDKVAIVNEEVELPLTKEAYHHLKEKADGFIIEKTRYLIPLDDKLKIELDVFSGRLKGLIFAEVEFPDEEQAGGFVMPDWFEEDISFDKRFRNSYLATVNSVEELHLGRETNQDHES